MWGKGDTFFQCWLICRNKQPIFTVRVLVKDFKICLPDVLVNFKLSRNINVTQFCGRPSNVLQLSLRFAQNTQKIIAIKKRKIILDVIFLAPSLQLACHCKFASFGQENDVIKGSKMAGCMLHVAHLAGWQCITFNCIVTSWLDSDILVLRSEAKPVNNPEFFFNLPLLHLISLHVFLVNYCYCIFIVFLFQCLGGEDCPIVQSVWCHWVSLEEGILLPVCHVSSDLFSTARVLRFMWGANGVACQRRRRSRRVASVVSGSVSCSGAFRQPLLCCQRPSGKPSCNVVAWRVDVTQWDTWCWFLVVYSILFYNSMTWFTNTLTS